MNLVIRFATAADARKIAAFNVALARETEERVLNRRLVGIGVRTLLKEPAHGFYVVADTGKKVVGMAMVTFEWSDWLNQQWWWLQSVYVDPAARRQGVFSKIYRFIDEAAGQRENVCGLRLYAKNDNRSAHRTYRSLGMAQNGYRVFEGPLGKIPKSARKSPKKASEEQK